MALKDNQLPVASSAHCLTGQPLRRWWQLSSPRKAATNNPAIQQAITFLLTLPFIVAVGFHSWPAEQRLALTALGMLAWVSAFVMGLFFARRHLYHVLEVRTHEDALELKSLFFKRTVAWIDIVDFFNAGNREIARNTYVLETRNGDEFLLSTSLSDSDKLFALITNKMQQPVDTYEQNFRTVEGFIDASFMMDYALTLAFAFPVLSLLFRGGHPSPEGLMTLLFGVLLVGALLYIHFFKVPETIRTGNQTLFFRTRSGGYRIPWTQVKSIKQFGPLFVFNSQEHGWFIMIADKNEPITNALVERRQKLVLTKHN